MFLLWDAFSYITVEAMLLLHPTVYKQNFCTKNTFGMANEPTGYCKYSKVIKLTDLTIQPWYPRP
jgi:hypothetical protein